MKYLTWILVICLFIVTFGTATVAASDEKPEEFSVLERGAIKYAPDEIVVKFRQDNKPFRVIKVPDGKVNEKIEEYCGRPGVVYAEPNYYAHAFEVPDDQLYVDGYQWNFNDSSTGGINLEEAWDVSTGAGVTVAIVDTGIAYENYSNYYVAPDLTDTSFVAGYDFVNNDSHPNDDNSHGTHVAGTVAQSTNNSIGVAGIAYNASLMPVKVLDKKGSGTYTDIANGIQWAADNGAQVINLSLGGPYSSQTLENAVAYAYGKGVTIVAAAGNDGMSSVSYPAAYDSYVIAVGATRYDKNLAYYSNYGTSLDLVAPGGDTSADQNGDGYGDGILQNTFNPTSKRTSDFGYYFFQGTSMASPHVAGIAALLIANGNATTPSEIESALQETALDLGASGRDDTYGYGLANAYNALNWNRNINPNTAPTADDQSLTTSEDTSVAITLSATDSDPSDDVLTFIVVSNPSNGTLTGSEPNVTYTPNPDYSGADSFSFKANDGMADSNLATVSIEITPVNDPPLAQSQSVSVNKDSSVDIVLTATDPDDDLLTYIVDNSPVNGTLSGTGANVIYTPDPGYTGEDSFTFFVDDGIENSNAATVSITITEIPAITIVTLDINMVTNSRKAGKNIFVWAIAEVHTGLEEVIVEGHWEGITSDVDSGITGVNGDVSLQSDSVKNPTSSNVFIFVVDKVIKDGILCELTGEISKSIMAVLE